MFSNESAIHVGWPKYWSFSFPSVLPKSIQGWLPLRLSGLISLLSKGLSRVFSTTVQNHQLFSTLPTYCPTLTSVIGLANICYLQTFWWSNCQHPLDHSKSIRAPEKTSISALLIMPKPLTVWITINCGKFFKRWEYQTTQPASWETCMQVRKQ